MAPAIRAEDQIHQPLGHQVGIKLAAGAEDARNHDIAEEAKKRRYRGENGHESCRLGNPRPCLHA